MCANHQSAQSHKYSVYCCNTRVVDVIITSIMVVLMLCILPGCGSAHTPTSAAKSETMQSAQQHKSSDTTTNTATADTSTTNESNGIQQLHVKGSQLLGEDNQPVQLRGVSTHGIAWYPQYVNETLFANLKKNWHINAVRLAMYTAESGGYTQDGDKTQLKEIIDRGVKAAQATGLYVIIDWHMLSDNNPNMHVDDAVTFFTAMSEKYGSIPNVLFEICNEPNGSTTWNDVKQYASRVIPTIRQHAPDSIILVGTPTWSQDIDQVQADPLAGDLAHNVMYTLHFYASTHKDELRNRMITAIKAGIPVFVSEFGITEASGDGAIDYASADQWIRVLDEYHVSFLIWNMSNKNEQSALFTTDETNNPQDADLSAQGRWFKAMMTGSK